MPNPPPALATRFSLVAAGGKRDLTLSVNIPALIECAPESMPAAAVGFCFLVRGSVFSVALADFPKAKKLKGSKRIEQIQRRK
jgi:hypothetical protein